MSCCLFETLTGVLLAGSSLIHLLSLSGLILNVPIRVPLVKSSLPKWLIILSLSLRLALLGVLMQLSKSELALYKLL